MCQECLTTSSLPHPPSPSGSADVLVGTANGRANEKAVSDTLLTLHSPANGDVGVPGVSSAKFNFTRHSPSITYPACLTPCSSPPPSRKCRKHLEQSGRKSSRNASWNFKLSTTWGKYQGDLSRVFASISIVLYSCSEWDSATAAGARRQVACSPRAITTLPVRTVSMMLNCENMVIAASIFRLSPLSMTIIEVGVRSTVLPEKCSAI